MMTLWGYVVSEISVVILQPHSWHTATANTSYGFALHLCLLLYYFTFENTRRKVSVIFVYIPTI